MKTKSPTHNPHRYTGRTLAGLVHLIAVIAAILLSFTAEAVPLGTSFSYQGRLTDGGQPANGSYEFEFTLCDAGTGGINLGTATVAAVQVTDGIFTVQLDYGAAAFDGNARWLEILVRKDNDGLPGAVLTPRQAISAAPYAQMAKTVPDGAITGTKLANGAVSGNKIAAGAVGSAHIATGGIQAQNLANGAVGAAQIATGAISSNHISAGAVGGTQIAGGAVTNDKMGTGAAFQNLLAGGQSPVASGGVIMSQLASAPELTGAGYVQVGKADLVTESWAFKASAPDGPPAFNLSLNGNAAVWSAAEMLVWGGQTNAGGRYNPSTNTWTPMSTVNAPAARMNPTAVWTGTEMIVWGGTSGGAPVNTGGRYNPATNTWTAITTTGAPSARDNHTAVWTGSVMIVWGGTNAADTALADGARYNPATNSWTAVGITGSPLPQAGHLAVWTGTYMLVFDTSTGAGEYGSIERYNLAANSWDKPHQIMLESGIAAVWTGTEVLILAGDYLYQSGFTNEGGIYRYNPATNALTFVPRPAYAEPHSGCSMVWDGTRAIIVGPDQAGSESASVIFTPGTGAWSQIALDGAPPFGSRHIAVWTGSRMITWGGGYITGGRYNPVANTWESMAKFVDGGERGEGFSSLWTGSEFLVWGGLDSTGAAVRGGLRYSQASNTWSVMSTANAPVPRKDHAAVWTGTQMIIWGGNNNGAELNSGGRYNPVTDTWTAVETTGSPSASNSKAVWTGTEMIVVNTVSNVLYGGRYNPVTNAWTPLTMTGAPAARTNYALLWTGTEMILWGGGNGGVGVATGGGFNPATNTWTATSLTNAPPGRSFPGAVWTGREMIIYGGGPDFGGLPSTHARYNPVTNTWTTLSIPAGFVDRTSHSVTWNGTHMIVWGGKNAAGDPLADGRLYSPDDDKWTPVSTTGAPWARCHHGAVWTGTNMLLWGGTADSTTERLMFSYTPQRTYYFYLRP